MSHRRQDSDSPRLSSLEHRAHAHGERHRIKGELHTLATSVGQSLDIDECDEPAVGWKPVHHHEPDHDAAKVRGRRSLRHWKVKQWKRRTTNRRNRIAKQQRLIDEL